MTLRHVFVLAQRLVVFVGRALDVVLVDEVFDDFLDRSDTWREPAAHLRGGLGDQLVVAEHLAGLHDTHNGSLYEENE